MLNPWGRGYTAILKAVGKYFKVLVERVYTVFKHTHEQYLLIGALERIFDEFTKTDLPIQIDR